MKDIKRLLRMPVVPAVFYFAFAKPLNTYLDPGTGSIIFQVVIGVAVGGFFTIVLYWKKVRTFFKNLFSRGEKYERDRD